MRQEYGIDERGNLEKAISNFKNPSGLILITTEENFEKHVNQLENIFPNVPSIGAVCMSYVSNSVIEKGVTVIALYEAKICADVIEQLSTMPMKYIGRVEKAMQDVGTNNENTVCFDFCCGHDGKMVTTINFALDKKKIPLVGGTVDCNKVSVNGKIYEDSCAFMMIKNEKGKIRAYRENIYVPTGERFIATNTNPESNSLMKINNISAEEFYRNKLNITKDEIATQTFKNPLGLIYGNQNYIISVKEVNGESLVCYKQVNDLDILTIMKLDDYDKIIENTIDTIKNDLKNLQGVLSVNCIIRYLLFKQENYMDKYLSKMNKLGNHVGFIGLGEHFDKKHINQTMCCIAFE